MNLGEKIRKLRERMQLGYYELAKLTHIPAQALAAVEDGHRQLTHAELQSLSNALDVSVDVLFQEGDGIAPPAQSDSVLIPVDQLAALLDQMKKG